MEAWHFQSVTIEQKALMTSHRCYAVTVERECMTCGKGGNHPPGACSKFQGSSREERCYVVKKAALCKNCLKPGDIASNCRAPPMFKKCNIHHLTLLDIEADPKTEETKVAVLRMWPTRHRQKEGGGAIDDLSSRAKSWLLMPALLRPDPCWIVHPQSNWSWNGLLKHYVYPAPQQP